jgi:pyridinium-3,5-biscarboxylic acid mononucleotide sulfurtransferase
MAKTLERKLEDLRKSIHRLDSALAAFSGEVDNSFLMRISRQELGEKAISLRALASLYPGGELSMARRIARIMGAKNLASELPPQGRRMPPVSKSLHTYSSLKSLAIRAQLEHAIREAQRKGVEPGKCRSLIVYKHAGLQSPILESSVSKAEIRLLAKELGLPNWERGVRERDSARLARKAEAARKYLVSLGFMDAKITSSRRRINIYVGKEELVLLAINSEAILKRMKSLGFTETHMNLC